MLKHLITLLVLGTALLTSCTEQAPAKQPNIVYVFADQWRASSVGYTSDPNIKTPNLDKLASQSLDFTNCVSVNPVCTPYRAALMTGRFPTTTGMFVNDLYLPSEELCMAEIFGQAGYNTAYIGKWHLDGHGRHAYIPPSRRQGWDYWKGAECDHNNNRSHYFTGDSNKKHFWKDYDVFAQTADAQSYIQAHSDDEAPFVLMLSYGPPHPASPKAPQEYLDMYPVDDIVLSPNVPQEHAQEARLKLQNYYALGTAVDQAIGDLMQTLEETQMADNTIFVFTSDHGGMIRSHGLPSAWKQVAWDESSHVPFLMRYPAAHGDGRVVTTPFNTPDILPTLLGLSDVEVPETVEGEDLSTLVTDGHEVADRSVLYMSVAPIVGQGEAYRALRTDRYSYVHHVDGSRQLFDNVKDPYQMNDLIDDVAFATLSDHLETELQAKLKAIGDDFRPATSYIEQWGYTLGSKNEIPYRGDAKVQSPM